MQVCRTCGVEKPLTSFHRDKSRTNGHVNRCKECTREYAGKRYRTQPEVREATAARSASDRNRETRLMRLYGITSAQYDELLESQGGGCAICGRPPKNVRLSVDHDHKTGLTRGLLCWHCNTRLLGAARENPQALRNAADYLESPPAVRVLGEVYGRKGRVTNKRRKRKRS